MAEFLVATKAAPDAAVSHHTALEFHGRVYSLWSDITFLTTHNTWDFRFGPVEYVPVRPPVRVAHLPDMDGGVAYVPSGGGIARASTCGRARVDVLHAPVLGLGWEEILQPLSMVKPFFTLTPWSSLHSRATRR